MYSKKKINEFLLFFFFTVFDKNMCTFFSCADLGTFRVHLKLVSLWMSPLPLMLRACHMRDNPVAALILHEVLF